MALLNFTERPHTTNNCTLFESNEIDLCPWEGTQDEDEQQLQLKQRLQFQELNAQRLKMCSTALNTIKKRVKIMKPLKINRKYSVPQSIIRPKVIQMTIEKPNVIDPQISKSQTKVKSNNIMKSWLEYSQFLSKNQQIQNQFGIQQMHSQQSKLPFYRSYSHQFDNNSTTKLFNNLQAKVQNQMSQMSRSFQVFPSFQSQRMIIQQQKKKQVDNNLLPKQSWQELCIDQLKNLGKPKSKIAKRFQGNAMKKRLDLRNSAKSQLFNSKIIAHNSHSIQDMWLDIAKNPLPQDNLQAGKIQPIQLNYSSDGQTQQVIFASANPYQKQIKNKRIIDSIKYHQVESIIQRPEYINKFVSFFGVNIFQKTLEQQKFGTNQKFEQNNIINL